MSDLLTAQMVRKVFGGLVAVNDVDFTIPEGSIVSLIGPNGAGKTTLVGLLSGTIRPDRGSIALRGRDITRDALAFRVKQGLVRTFQVSSLFARLTVLENVFLAISENAGASHGLWRPAGRRRDLIERAEAILERLQLSESRHRRVTEISYGSQRLLEIAIALALEPKVLLLDEPAAGIPSDEVGVLLDAVAGLPSDIAILMIEHDMHVVRRFATEVYVLVHGRVLTVGPPAEVMASPEVRAVYLGTSGQSRFAGGAHGA
jgi:branched-chain amino acid transport system ATP-binding protein